MCVGSDRGCGSDRRVDFRIISDDDGTAEDTHGDGKRFLIYNNLSDDEMTIYWYGDRRIASQGVLHLHTSGV